MKKPVLGKTFVAAVASAAIITPLAVGLTPASAAQGSAAVVSAVAVRDANPSHAAFKAYRKALAKAHVVRRAAGRVNQHVYLAAVANARVTRDQALAATMVSAERLAARAAFRAACAAALTARVAANDIARANLDASIEAASESYIAASVSANKQALVDYVAARHAAWNAFGVSHRANRDTFFAARDAAITVRQAAVAASNGQPNHNALRRSAWATFNSALHTAWLIYSSADNAAKQTRQAAVATARATYVATTGHNPII